MTRLASVESDYWRNRDGSVVHSNDCMYSGSKGVAPWPYANGKAKWQVRMKVNDTPWLRLCGKCWGDSDD